MGVSLLFAGVIAPLSVLYNVLAIMEEWYFEIDGTLEPLYPEQVNVVLLGVSLAFGISANSLMVFWLLMDPDKGRCTHRYLIPFSATCWLAKGAITITNLFLFSLKHGNGYTTFVEGYWCFVVSLSTTLFVLLIMMIFELEGDLRYFIRSYYNKYSHTDEIKRVAHVSGHQFVLQNTLFLGIVALTAFVFSCIEDWAYLDAICFTIVTFLTVGFGADDSKPTQTSTRIILFPLSIIGITILAKQVDTILTFLKDRLKRHKAQVQAKLELEWRQVTREDLQLAGENVDEIRHLNLYEEIQFLGRLSLKQVAQDQLLELLAIFLGLVITWLVGAAIFSSLESWSYSTGLYFSSGLLLTIGYDEYVPQSPAGRVAFIFYLLLVVPLTASFTVYAVTQGKEQISFWFSYSRNINLGAKSFTGDIAVPHAQLLEDVHNNWMARQDKCHHDSVSHADDTSNVEQDSEDMSIKSSIRAVENISLAKAAPQGPDGSVTMNVADDSQSVTSNSSGWTFRDEQHICKASEQFAQELLERAIELEQRARRMMVYVLPDGSPAQVLLRADRAVQAQDVHILTLTGTGAFGSEERENEAGREHGEDAGAGINRLAKLGLGEDEDFTSQVQTLDDDKMVEEIEGYRACVAALLYAGRRLMKLEGIQAALLERRPYPHPERDHPKRCTITPLVDSSHPADFVSSLPHTIV